MPQQTGSGGPMLNLPYAYFYGGNMMPSGFQYGTPTMYPVSFICYRIFILNLIVEGVGTRKKKTIPNKKF